ncbi:MAG: TonB-dependent receptor, partial [Bacteroidetes bacterium HGW-Bacteroidetes-21]
MRYLLFILLLSPSLLFSQRCTINGQVTDEKGSPVELVSIFIKESPNIGTITDVNGRYWLDVPCGSEVHIIFTHLEFFTEARTVKFNVAENAPLNIKFKHAFTNLPGASVSAKLQRINNLVKLDPKIVSIIPDVSGGIEAILKAMPGVVKNNELSSQYSVRGGNFDENLVYVNGIEVYRPMLTRSGQQEGLSFVNPDLVSSIYFSAGGFDAKYGDKMASVLDIQYKKPKETAASASAGLMGASAHIEGCSDNHRFTYITGWRYRTYKSILSSMDTKGDYKPSFHDVQTYLTYDVSEKFELSFLGNLALNTYHFIPQTRETSFGTVDEALKLKIYFDGQELDKFNTLTGAIAGNYQMNDRLKMTYTLSAYQASESETFDIMGQYFLNELDKELGSDNLGDSLMNIGVGTFLNHARNELQANVYNAGYRGEYKKDNNALLWGVNYQHEYINDKLNEWEMVDSAGYSIPYNDSVVGMNSSINSERNFYSNRITSFLQQTWFFEKDSQEFSLTAGCRLHYWDFSNELLISPRISASYKPAWKRDVLFRAATGIYYQPPFYKELRNLQGEINEDIKSQRSYHFVLGSDYQFTAWNREFKFITEVYYKYFQNLIPYFIENVRIRYTGENNATGYATGIDLKVNGEFVQGVESWASISVMQTRENISNDVKTVTDENGNVTITYPGYIPRPTDQLVNFGLFFQDYLPMNPSYKMQLSLLFGSGLPFGPPKSERYEQVFRMPPYRRVDIGFSKVIINDQKENLRKGPTRFIKSLWTGIEIYNLLDTKNTVSYQWISDIRDHQYAVPNFLTSRRLNIR